MKRPASSLTTRRTFLATTALKTAAISMAGVAGNILAAPSLKPDGRRLRIAAVITEFSYRSHAHVILENFLEPYLFNGALTSSGMDVVSLYVDQFPEKEYSRAISKKYGIPIHKTIASALCCGGSKLAVDAVLSIGEHGKYPTNAKAQIEYPRKRFFDEIVQVFRASGRSVPVFNDKHLSYRWDWAKEMYDTSRKLKFPLMAGSSVPLAQRIPTLELAPGARITEAMSIHGGGVESYDIHGLEVLQSMTEARHGGETGVESVQFLQGGALWQAARDGRWSPALIEAAFRSRPIPTLPAPELLARPETRLDGGSPFISHGILIRYKDGTRGTMLAAGITGIRWYFSCLLKGEPAPVGTSFYVGPWQNRNLFKALSHAIQDHFRKGRPPYPVERTLMTTGILDAAMDSRINSGQEIKTPQLRFSYKPTDYRAMREMGRSWEIITEDRPEPAGIDYGGT